MPTLSKQDLLDYATRYVNPEEIVDFPGERDLFAFISRPVADAATPDGAQSWAFGGYGVCMGYDLDTESKPEGKWVFMKYGSLAIFPPEFQTLKLQPPHVVTGRFHSFDRSREIRIVKVSLAPTPEGEAPAAPEPKPRAPRKGRPAKRTEEAAQGKGKILKFRPKEI